MTTLPTTAETPERHRYVFPSGVEPAPDILDDDMPEPMFQHPFFFDTVTVLRTYFEDLGHALADGDYPVYYRDADGAQTHFKPDCAVTFNVNPRRIYERNGYFIEEVGKPPDFVLEIGSTTTADNDTGYKRDLYERLGIREYFGFDGTGGEYYGVPLFGWRLRQGVYVPVGTTRDANGATWAYSEALGLYFCAEPESLRVWDPKRKGFLNRLSESERALQTTREALQAEREANAARIRELEERLRRVGGG